MQGQRSTFAPFSDIFEIGRPSSSDISIMDQQMLRNDLPLSVENQDLPCNLLSSSETISCENVTTQENANMNFWGPLGFSSSISSLNHCSQSETKFESGWTSSAPGNRVGGPTITDSRYEAMNTLSFETDNAEPSINLVDNRQPSSQFLDFNEPPTENVEMSRQFLETQLHSGPSNQGLSPCQHVPSSGSSLGGSSASAINLFSNYDGGKQKIEESSSHKRKNIKRDDGECSASGHSSNFSEGEEINARISKLPRGATTDHPYVSTSGNSESFQRNTRVKISHANEADNFTPGLWPLENNITCYGPWPAQSSSATASSSQSLYSGYLGINLRPHRQRNLRTLPAFSSVSYPFPQSEITNMEVGSSLGSPAVTVDGSLVELDQLDVPINISEQVSVPSSSTTDMMRGQTNWHSASGTTVSTSNLVPTSQVGSNLGLYQSSGTSWLTHQNRRRISESIRRNILSSDFEFRGQTISFPQHQNNSSTTQEVGRRGAVSCVHQHPHTRLNMLHRHSSGALNIPLSARTLAAAGEGRNRMSGIRNVFDRIRRGDNLLLEDVLLLEQSAFVGGANFPDRYRDMRLDVDNMSYEELLALGERIGSVNTGLSEEKILECLQQHKYVTVASEPTGEVEPCCICREEYIEGEELGQLDCGHNFHSLCIKKWLVIKNVCPICKTTALST